MITLEPKECESLSFSIFAYFLVSEIATLIPIKQQLQQQKTIAII